ncbi:MAG: alpha/beta hydrolase [Gammaproteobacteria bacterium]|nr:alpha/beta hydrolase [Gammaproteobacteria bacterium]
MKLVSDDLIEMRGLRFHYRDWQTKARNAPCLILLHGFTGHARSWDTFADVASERFRVLALDQRGHGESDWSDNSEYGPLEMKEDLNSFVHAFDLKEYFVVGLSMGGTVAIHFAAQKPVGLKKLVIVDIAPEIAVTGIRSIQEGVSQTDIFESIDEAFKRARSANPVPPEDTHYHRIRHSLMRTENGKWTFKYDRALRQPNELARRRPSVEEGWSAVKSIEVPTLLVRGERSNLLTSDVANKFVDLASNCKLVEIKGSGHSVPLDKPKDFQDAVLSFL